METVLNETVVVPPKQVYHKEDVEYAIMLLGRQRASRKNTRCGEGGDDCQWEHAHQGQHCVHNRASVESLHVC